MIPVSPRIIRPGGRGDLFQPGSCKFLQIFLIDDNLWVFIKSTVFDTVRTDIIILVFTFLQSVYNTDPPAIVV